MKSDDRIAAITRLVFSQPGIPVQRLVALLSQRWSAQEIEFMTDLLTKGAHSVIEVREGQLFARQEPNVVTPRKRKGKAA